MVVWVLEGKQEEGSSYSEPDGKRDECGAQNRQRGEALITLSWRKVLRAAPLLCSSWPQSSELRRN